jgi:hypothetical protein
MYRHIPNELRLEMRGVAAGAGVPFWDVLLLNCFDDLLHSLWRIPMFMARLPLANRFGLACSSFALLGERTANGRLLHGRNLDYEVAADIAGEGTVTQVLRENVVAIECEPERGHGFLSIGWPGIVGVVTSLSEPGLSLSCHTSTVTGETPNGMPLPMLYRGISQYAKSVDEAERMVRGVKRTIGNNLLVASGEDDDARVFELSPHGVAARSPVKGTLRATNHFVDETAAVHQNGWVFPASIHRYDRLQELCEADGCNPGRAGRVLRDTLSLSPDGNTWSCLANPGTIYSTVAEPATGRFWLRAADRPDRDFVELQPTWASRNTPAAV